uniref:Uncharacterized protein n=1 Tax=Onchocerca volvulus TaxID=6282 RepID=A0A8R1Y3M1_ONCVO
MSEIFVNCNMNDINILKSTITLHENERVLIKRKENCVKKIKGFLRNVQQRCRDANCDKETAS